MKMRDYNKISTSDSGDKVDERTPINRPDSVSSNPPIDNSDMETQEERISVIVTNCDRLNVRKLPSKTAKVISIVNKGDILFLAKDTSDNDNDNWAYVEFYEEPGLDTDGDTIKGYVMGEFIKEA
jgi:hypothetical protein